MNWDVYVKAFEEAKERFLIAEFGEEQLDHLRRRAAKRERYDKKLWEAEAKAVRAGEKAGEAALKKSEDSLA
jgi:hypothetical protein